MKTLAWMTFVVSFAFAMINLNRISLDQTARNISGTVDQQSEFQTASTATVRSQDMRDFENISKAIGKTGEK